MKTSRIVPFAVVLLVSEWASCGQGFVNLDFENATIVPDPSMQFAVYANQALSGWTAYVGDRQLSTVVYNTIPTGSTDVSILDTQGVPASLAGVYSVYLSGGTGGLATQATIKQTGMIPANTQSISFIARHYGLSEGTLSITLGGQEISIVTIFSHSGYAEYAGVIPASLAGLTTELVFSAATHYTTDNNWLIDDIRFSPVPVPEPTVLGFAALAIGCLCWQARRFNHRTRRTRDDATIP